MTLNKKSNWTLALAASFALTGCFGSDSDEGSSSASVVPEVSKLLYDLPSSMTGGSAALTREVGDSGSVWDAYKIIPLYIGLAEAAKDSVAALVTRLEASNLPENFEMDTEDGMHLVSRTIDTTIAGLDQKFFKITASKDGQLIISLFYWKNARDQYRGNIYLLGTDGEDSGNAVWVHFNNHNEEAFGRRMVVLAAVNPETLVGEKASDPAVLRVVAVKKGDKVFVSGVSWHPNFVDSEGFWDDGAKIYAFQAAANLTEDVAVLRAAFAPDTVSISDLWTDYSLDKQVLERGTVGFRTFMGSNPEAAKLVLWSIENNKSIDQAWLDTAGYAEFLAWEPTRTIESLTSADLRAYLDLNEALIQSGDDEGMKEYLAFVNLRQPIFLRAGAAIVGAEVETGFGIAAEELDSEALPEVNLADAVEVTPADVMEMEDPSEAVGE